MKILLVTTESIGGRGGIAQYNMDLIYSLISSRAVSSITLIQKIQRESIKEKLSDKIDYITNALKSNFHFVFSVVKYSLFKKYNIIICGHINYLWLLCFLNIFKLKKITLFVYGIEVWQPVNILSRMFLSKIGTIVSISNFTASKMNAWANLDLDKIKISPNAIHLENYKLKTKSKRLFEKYAIQQDKKILFTLCRLDATERYKGIDVIIDLMPQLLKVKDVHYLVGGSGSDKDRLQMKVKDIGLDKNVTFIGYVDENEKNEHYSMADLFVMPSKGEGFGFVYLESLANGVPVIASNKDGGQEALLYGKLGTLVDPDKSDEVLNAILSCLEADSGKAVPPDIEYFSYLNFKQRIHKYLQVEYSE